MFVASDADVDVLTIQTRSRRGIFYLVPFTFGKTLPPSGPQPSHRHYDERGTLLQEPSPSIGKSQVGPAKKNREVPSIIRVHDEPSPSICLQSAVDAIPR